MCIAHAQRGDLVSEGKGEARQYSWEQFKPGNQVALQHGAYSATALEPLAREIEARARAAEDWPSHLVAGRYDTEVQAWAWAEAICLRLRAFLADQDPVEWLSETIDTEEEEEQLSLTHHRRVSHTRRVQSALEQLRRFETLAGNRREKLGLTPVTAARLARDLMAARHSSGVDLAQLIQQANASVEGEGDG
jgi:hypothetical protein